MTCVTPAALRIAMSSGLLIAAPTASLAVIMLKSVMCSQQLLVDPPELFRVLLAQRLIGPVLRRSRSQALAYRRLVPRPPLVRVPTAEDDQCPAVQPHPRLAALGIAGHGIPDPAALTHTAMPIGSP